MSGFPKDVRPRSGWDPAVWVALLAAALVLVTVGTVFVTVLAPGSIPLAARIIALCGFRLNDDMQMGPPPGGDPAGMSIVVAGAAITLLAFFLAIRATVFPGEQNRAHPKYLILHDDR